MRRSFPRRVFLELRQFRIHRVPWLRVGRPNFVLRFVQTRIIQSPSRDALSEICRSAGCFLAVATVTIERHNWFRGNFITNRAAGAATGNRFHFVTLKLVTVFIEQRPIVLFPSRRKVVV